jgi:hypothetical protein
VNDPDRDVCAAIFARSREPASDDERLLRRIGRRLTVLMNPDPTDTTRSPHLDLDDLIAEANGQPAGVAARRHLVSRTPGPTVSPW